MTTIINGSSPSITFSDGSAQTSATRPFQNRIINGGMVIDQRNAGASLTNNGSSQYSVDRWRQNSSQASKFTVQQNAGSVTPPVGFTNYLGFTTTSAVTIASSDYFWFGTTIEGYNSADLNWGTANGKTVTVSFWAYASITGSYTLMVKSGGYSYATSFSVTNANTWQYITVTIPPLTAGGAVNTTNGTGIQVNFSLGMGSTYYTSTTNTWLNGDFYALNGTVDTIATNGATFYITGVQLEVGSTATSFDYRPYGTELQLCQRYCYKYCGSGLYEPTGFNGVASSATRIYATFNTPTQMRATPTISFSTLRIDDYSSGYALTAMALDSSASGKVVIVYADIGSSSLTQYRYYSIIANNSTSAYSILSAEL